MGSEMCIRDRYDVVYPSGSSFDSKIKIHSATIRMEQALTTKPTVNDNMNLTLVVNLFLLLTCHSSRLVKNH